MDITYEDVHTDSIRLAEKIRQQMTVDLVVGVSRGGLLPGVIISHHLDRPFRALHWATRDFANQENEIDDFLLEEICSGKQVLIVDDISDSGRTFDTIRDKLITRLQEKNNLSVLSNVEFASLYVRRDTIFTPTFFTKWIVVDDWLNFPFEKQLN